MALVFTLLGIGIACGVIVGITNAMSEKNEPPLFFSLLGGIAMIGVWIILILLPLAILVKVIQYFWNF